MSGGSFNYSYQRALDFADALDVKLSRFDEVDGWGNKRYHFSPEVLDKLHLAVSYIRGAANLMKEVEWLYSGDTGEAWFLKKMEGIEEFMRSVGG